MVFARYSAAILWRIPASSHAVLLSVGQHGIQQRNSPEPGTTSRPAERRCATRSRLPGRRDVASTPNTNPMEPDFPIGGRLTRCARCMLSSSAPPPHRCWPSPPPQLSLVARGLHAGPQGGRSGPSCAGTRMEPSRGRQRQDSETTGLEGNGWRSPVGWKPSRSYSLRAAVF
jgi:hypothetical protein